MSISLIIGHYYRMADGSIEGPVEANIESFTHPFRIRKTHQGKVYYHEYMPNGQFWSSMPSNISDLIEDMGRHPTDL
jgi:hypothetical protein